MHAPRLAIGLLFGLLLHMPVIVACKLAPNVICNMTASVPRGLYRRRSDIAPVSGKTVVLPVPGQVRGLVSDRRYLPPGAQLMKVVVAGPGDQVCLDGAEYRVNGRLIGTVRDADSLGRRLEPYRFCGDVRPGEAYVATSAPLSFDSRYFGPVPLSTLTVVEPLWTFSR
jgi:conjugative transfer signal peptidase TraF